MKNTIKLSVAAVLASTVMIATPAVAASPGQLQGGDNTYVVKNVTKGTDYSSAVSTVSCGDTIRYSIQLSNTGFGELTGINVKTTLGNTSNMTAVPAEGTDAGTSASTTVALGKGQTLAYVPGSTQLYDTNAQPVTTLADTITTTGVNVGDLAGSTNEFVNFNATVKCDTPATPETPVTPEAPTELPETGAGAPLAGLFGAGAMGVAAMLYNRSRKAVKRS